MRTVRDDPPRLSPNAEIVLAERYLRKDAEGRLIEDPEELFLRVARAVAAAEFRNGGESEAARHTELFYDAMRSLSFLPNSPTLMNAGRPGGQLAACFVLPVEDSLRGIFDSVRNMALIHQSGGGTGFSFSRIRPRGDVVGETGGVASGPLSFMRVFDVTTDVIKQGGRRRGASMAVLSAHHPDVVEFVRAKRDPSVLPNFNLSVALPDRFIQAVFVDEMWDLVHPRTKAVVARLPARELWREIVHSAWSCGEPGVLFIDEIERHNPAPALGRLEATNPCGEQPLLPFESCVLGSIHLGLLAGPAGFDWERLDDLVSLGVRFLDNVLEVTEFPTPEIEQATLATRKVGLGVMGFAEVLVRLGIPYATEEARVFAMRVMSRIETRAHACSEALAAERGSFPAFARSVWAERGWNGMRNATCTTIAPTGTLSILANATSGIEPLFAVAYERHVLDGRTLREVSPLFVSALERLGLPREELVRDASRTGSVQGLDALPLGLRALFRTAHEIPPEWHLRLQAAFQAHTDNAVSKTVNLARDATQAVVAETFERAWRSRLKGVTVFREGCRGDQVLTAGGVPGFAVGEDQAEAHAEYAGDCRVCGV